MAELAMLADSGRLNHKVVTRPASSLVQDRESSLAETSILITMLRRQQQAGHPDKICLCVLEKSHCTNGHISSCVISECLVFKCLILHVVVTLQCALLK